MSTHDATTKASRKKKPQEPVPLKDNPTTPGEQNLTTPPTFFSLRRRDDLLSIEGIDPTTEMALNSIGIHQYADFRGYSPETLAQILQERTGVAVAATKIASQDWIGWAEILAAENHSACAAEADGPKAAEKTIKNVPAHIEIASTGEQAEALALHIQEAKFTHVATPDGKILRGEINCALAGEPAPTATDSVALCAQIYIINKITGEPRLMASRLARLLPEQMTYRLLLEFKIPEIGVYQLQAVAFLLQPVAKVAFYQGPPLRVIA